MASKKIQKVLVIDASSSHNWEQVFESLDADVEVRVCACAAPQPLFTRFEQVHQAGWEQLNAVAYGYGDLMVDITDSEQRKTRSLKMTDKDIVIVSQVSDESHEEPILRYRTMIR